MGEGSWEGARNMLITFECPCCCNVFTIDTNNPIATTTTDKDWATCPECWDFFMIDPEAEWVEPESKKPVDKE